MLVVLLLRLRLRLSVVRSYECDELAREAKRIDAAAAVEARQAGHSQIAIHHDPG